MAERRPIVYISGVLSELPPGDGVPCLPRRLASVDLESVRDGELVFDLSTSELVMRHGDFLSRYSQAAAQSTPGGFDFSDADNSIWLGA